VSTVEKVLQYVFYFTLIIHNWGTHLRMQSITVVWGAIFFLSVWWGFTSHNKIAKYKQTSRTLKTGDLKVLGCILAVVKQEQLLIYTRHQWHLFPDSVFVIVYWQPLLFQNFYRHCIVSQLFIPNLAQPLYLLTGKSCRKRNCAFKVRNVLTWLQTTQKNVLTY